jgi:hypothetical protein
VGEDVPLGRVPPQTERRAILVSPLLAGICSSIAKTPTQHAHRLGWLTGLDCSNNWRSADLAGF